MGRSMIRMFGRMSRQKRLGSSTIRQETTVCYSKNRAAFVRHEPDIPDHAAPHTPTLLAL